jgi:hypothetical protein
MFDATELPLTGIGITSFLSISDKGTIADVNVVLDMKDTMSIPTVFVGLTLENVDSGKTVAAVTLLSRNACVPTTATGEVNFKFDADATVSVKKACLVGDEDKGKSVKPSQADGLSKFKGKAIEGDWILNVDSGFDFTLDSWGLEITSCV